MSETSGSFAALDRRCLRQLHELGLEFKHFFDVGASNGGWTRRVAADFPEATFDLFEPLLKHAPHFRQRVESTLVGPRFRVHPVALGDRCAAASLHICQNELPGTTTLALEALPPGFSSVQVEMLTIDTLVRTRRVCVPDVIKIDTQGFELEILKGARETLPQVRVLMLECWLVRDYGKSTPLLIEVADWLRQHDFHLWDFGDQWRNPEGLLVTQDCVFLNARCPASRLRDEPRLAAEPHSKEQLPAAPEPQLPEPVTA